jgi:hypothetical protein
MQYFVRKDSVVREIWGKADTILFIFGGAAAEFALNKAVDWLYFTGRLPADPLGRLFSTVSYARMIVFSREEEALKAIDKITSIHGAVEKGRGARIPDWAYRDVLYMLIHYSMASFELLERKMTPEEKEELYDVFIRMARRMNIPDLPENFNQWMTSREHHLQTDLAYSTYTKDLFAQYKKHLGSIRYAILLEGQKLVVPQKVKELLSFSSFSWIGPLLPLYKFLRWLKLDRLIKIILFPKEYQKQIRELDRVEEDI